MRNSKKQTRLTSVSIFLPATLIALLVSVYILLPGCTEGESNTGKAQKQDTAMTATNATTAKTQLAEIAGRKIAYRMTGQGAPMILCARFRGNLDSWDPAFLDALAKNYTVVTFNYSGFGSSTGNPPTTMLGFAKDVTDLAQALGYKKFILGGWSFGGAVAQTVITMYPYLVSHAILIGTKPPGKVEHGFEDIFWQVSRKPINSLEDEVILFFEPAWEPSRRAAKRSHDRIAERMKDPDTRIDEKVWGNYSAGFADFTADTSGAREKLTKTDVPILVISADHEICFPPENWFALNRKLPTTQVITIPRTGHGVHHEYPELVAQYITSFIQDRQ